jgi:5-methyltetrahydrofolate--homocysteine methyltransferase
MTTTTISSATREVHIGFDQPFVIIGERINPTGRKILAEEMKNGDYSRVEMCRSALTPPLSKP